MVNDYQEFDTAPEPLPTEAVRRRSSVEVHVRFGNADLAGWFVEQLELSGKERILELGCGVGYLSLPLARAVRDAGRVEAVDYVPEYAKAWEIIEETGELPLEFRTIPTDGALPWSDASFDAVVAGFSLLYVPDLSRTIAELRRVTAPRGRLLVCGPAPDDQADFRRFYEEVVDCTPRLDYRVRGRDMTTEVLPALDEAFGRGERLDFVNVLRFPRPVDLVEFFASSRLYRELEVDLPARDDLLDTIYHVAEDTIGREGSYTVTRHLLGGRYTR